MERAPIDVPLLELEADFLASLDPGARYLAVALERILSALREERLSRKASLALLDLCLSLQAFEDAAHFSRSAGEHGALQGSNPSEPRFCPCCGAWSERFLPGPNGRKAARCPRCQSLERHRLLWIYLRERTSLFTERVRLLHVAPESTLERNLRSLPNVDYVSADLASPSAAVRMDLTAIPFAEARFDAILCNHVLEHVEDDLGAMRELLRVLRPGGWAILQVPIDLRREKTYEDHSITRPEERQRHFGQADHVRWYGLDYEDRLRDAGFTVMVDAFVRTLGDALVERCALTSEEVLYVVRRRSDMRPS